MDGLVNLLAPIALSVMAVLGTQYVSNNTDSKFLERNIEVTGELVRSINELNIKVAVFNERFVTREELNSRLKELPNGS